MNAWIFDVDGVLVHLEKREIVETQLLIHILKLLQKGDLIAFVSGRSTGWQRDNVVKLLEEKATEISFPFSLFDNIILSGEFGGTRIHFEKGNEVDDVNAAHKIPKNVLQDLHEAARPYLSRFVIEPKQTIFTLFTTSFATFEEDKVILKEKLQQVVKKHGMESLIEVHIDTTAINIKYKEATKLYATEQVLEWIERKGATPAHFYGFGDSLSDIEIGKDLEKQKKPFTFIYVGDPQKLPTDLSFPVITTKERYDKGTLEFLTQSA